ncbi:hypothetical protein D3C73_1197900 [compost metagenome]
MKYTVQLSNTYHIAYVIGGSVITKLRTPHQLGVFHSKVHKSESVPKPHIVCAQWS